MRGYVGNNESVMNITIVSGQNNYVTDEDREMDIRAEKAVSVAIEKAIICGKPVAKYNVEEKKAYLEFPDGRIEYV